MDIETYNRREKRMLGTHIRFLAQVNRQNWYLVLYQIRDDTVYIDYILDCRKDYNWLRPSE